MFNDTFYPTPAPLIERMMSKLDIAEYRGQKYFNKSVLEPSAGMGDIVEYLDEKYSGVKIKAIEQDPRLQDVLRGKNIKVIDSDFLSYPALEQYDAIIMNPPFKDGHKHLQKAIDIMYNGDVLCILNAETLKNPCSNGRKKLVKTLEALNADIEYIQHAFKDADRKTNVEIALIHVKKENDIEFELFGGMSAEQEKFESLKASTELDHKKTDIHTLVMNYQDTQAAVNQQIVDFYRNYQKINGYLDLNVAGQSSPSKDAALNTKMRQLLSGFNKQLKQDYWKKTLQLKEVSSRLTRKGHEQFHSKIEQFQQMEFSVVNIRQLISNLSKNYGELIEEAIEEAFDDMTRHALSRYYFSEKKYQNNIHYYDGWKTNSAFKVGKRVILPSRGEYSRYNDDNMLRDYNKIMSYLDEAPENDDIVGICNAALKNGQSRHIQTHYFKISIYSQTIHITFKDQKLLRRFNIFAAKKKNFLPSDYATQNYKDLKPEDKKMVDEFEGKKAYKPELAPVPALFHTPDMPLLSHSIH